MTTLVRDSSLIFWAQLRTNLRNPVWVFIGLSQPVLYLVLFGPLIKGVAGSLGPGADPWKILTPALLLQIGMFGGLFVGFAIVGEMRSGVIERQRVTPAPRAALLIGRVGKDMVVVVVQSVLLILVAVLAFGMRPSPVGTLATLALIAILTAGLASAGYALGLWAKSEDTLAPLVNTISVPVLLLSGILLPMSLGPRWLQIVADINPISHTVTAARALFRGDFASSDVLTGVTITVLLAVVLIAIGARSFARENA